MIRLSSISLLLLLRAFAQEAMEVTGPEASRVSILGYHDFSETLPETEMRIRTAKFRKQMETIQQLGLNVISLQDFTDWKKSGTDIPENSILITIDDGWKSVYTDAFPILREMGYPFTLYLYKNYVDGGGKALTSPMIREMLKEGATIGSHSVSHPFPAEIRRRKAKNAKSYDRFLRIEIGESKRFLESRFKTKATTYAFPGGFTQEEMFPLLEEFGYQFAFTVQPKKVTREMPDLQLPRYMILGTRDRVFELATTFTEGSNPAAMPAGAIAGMFQTTAHPVRPEPGAIVGQRMPEISADLSKATDLDAESLEMRVSGFGQVPAAYDPETSRLSWTVNRKLRHPTCQIYVSWKTNAGESADALRWTFRIDREAAYFIEKPIKPTDS